MMLTSSQSRAEKPFLDTSVARSMLTGYAAYRRYLRDQLQSDRCYISVYVSMELKRLLVYLIDFYFTLASPDVETLGDALRLWAEEFGDRKARAALQWVQELFEIQEISKSSAQDKAAALRAVLSVLMRNENQIRTLFVDCGQDSPRCARGRVPLQIDLGEPQEGLRRFQEAFGAVKGCGAQCRIDTYLFGWNGKTIGEYGKHAEGLSKVQENRGFIKIAGLLREEQGRFSDTRINTCDQCAKIGDAVIALDAPREMELQHTDYSFDHLCAVGIQQPHRRLPSARAFHNTQIADAATEADLPG